MYRERFAHSLSEVKHEIRKRVLARRGPLKCQPSRVN